MYSNQFHRWLHALILIIVVVTLSFQSIALCNDYYVDPVNGSNFNSGDDPYEPWQSVQFALTGPHAPLPLDSTIHMFSGLYSITSNGESFPWRLYHNISLKADKRPDGSGDSWVADAESCGSRIIELVEDQDYLGGEICGYSSDEKMVFKNATNIIGIQPVAVTHAPLIQHCLLELTTYAAIRISGSANAGIKPEIIGNKFQSVGIEATAINCDLEGCQVTMKIDDNYIAKGGTSYPGHGIRLYGSPSGGGASSISGNTITFSSSNGSHCFHGVFFDNFTGQVDCVNNTIQYDGNAIYLKSCNPWNQDSRIAGNQCQIFNNYYGYGCIFVDWTNDVILEGNTCHDSERGQGIFASNSKRISILDNYCQNNAEYGIFMNTCHDGSLVEGNQCTGNRYCGIYLNNSDETTLVRNHVEYTIEGRGISLDNWSNFCNLIENTCISNAYMGIGVDSSEQVTVEKNVLLFNGGGLRITSKYATVIFNQMAYNNGLGVLDDNCFGSVYCCNMIFRNGDHGIKMAANSSSEPSLIINNTVVFNANNGLWTALASTTSPYVCSNILWYNGGLDIAGLAYGQYCHNNIEKGGSPGNDNICQKPEFVNPVIDDFHLTAFSPSINAGDNNSTLNENIILDFEGDPRIADGTVDMGADEFYPHLYITGNATPGGVVEGKLVGPPGTSPVGLLFGSDILDIPVKTPWGSFYLESPWLLLELITIPPSGVLVIPATIPLAPPAPYDVPMQALIGTNSNSLTNVCVLEVR